MAFWRRAGRSLPDDATAVFSAHLAEWPLLNEVERGRLIGDVEFLLETKRWEAARGFVLTDEQCVVIAAQAALLVNGLEVELLRQVKAIIVHPSTVVTRGPHPGPVAGLLDDSPISLAGEAHDRHGPVLLAWDVVRRETRRAGTGRNVVIHEFADKLDMLDGMIDGTPPMSDAVARRRWVEVFTAEYAALQAERAVPGAVLRDYAGTDPGECFAVAAEVFFDRPLALAEAKPALYDVLRTYFRQDPAARRAGS